ncbi:cysteine desulfurase-like protein [Frigoribacterium salinisoli]
MPFDVAAFRRAFPSLASGIAHFDGPGGTQTPRVVGEAIAAAMTAPTSIRGTSTLSERNAEATVQAFRSAYADLLGVDPRGVVHGRSATALTYDLSRALAKGWSTGDEVVVCRLDHDSDVRPWLQAAEAVGATVRWIEIDPTTGELDEASVVAAITGRTRLVALTGASNLLGTVPDVRAVADRAHAVGALVWVDAVHFAAHELVDATALGADFVVCSPYKFYGPHCGVLGAAPELLETLRPDKLEPSTDAVPERFELGTLPYEQLAGATAAVDFIAAIAPDAAGPDASRRERLTASITAVHEREHALRGRLEEALLAVPGLTLHSHAARRTPTLYVTIEGHRMRDLAAHLATRDVLAPAGHFYALEAARALGLDGDATGLRIGLAAYTSDDDVERLLAGVREFVGA